MDVLQEVLFASVALITLLIHHNNTMAPCKSDFFLGLRNVNRSKTCHRIPAFSLFFSKYCPKSKWYYSCALFKMCFAKDNNIDVLWCFSGQLFPSCEIQSPGSHQRDAMTIVGRIIISIIKLTHQASSSPSPNSSIIKLTHQASSSLDRFPA